MSKSNAFENLLMQFIFNKVPITAIGNTIYLALHTGDPGEAGDQTTSEAAYAGYARIGINCNGTGGFTVTGNTAVNTLEALFATSTSGPEVLTHFSYGVNPTGASMILYKAALASPLTINNNIAPRFAAGAISAQED